MIHSVNEAKNAAKELNEFLQRINDDSQLGKSNGFFMLTNEQIEIVRECCTICHREILANIDENKDISKQREKRNAILDLLNDIRSQELKLKGVW